MVISFPDGKGYPVTARDMSEAERQRYSGWKKKKMKLPNTDSIRELAEFWDTHEVTDFADQLEEVPEPVFGRREGASVTVPLSESERDAIRRMAESRGLDEAALIREWVQEKLHH